MQTQGARRAIKGGTEAQRTATGGLMKFSPGSSSDHWSTLDNAHTWSPPRGAGPICPLAISSRSLMDRLVYSTSLYGPCCKINGSMFDAKQGGEFEGVKFPLGCLHDSPINLLLKRCDTYIVDHTWGHWWIEILLLKKTESL